MSAAIRGYHFYHREAIQKHWTLNSALALLNGMRDDPKAMRSLREIVTKRVGVPPPIEAGDTKLLDVAARLRASGQLVVATSNGPMRTPSARQPASAPSAPAPRRESAGPKFFEEVATFSGNLNAALQAASLVAASLTGVPFCEECTRHRKQQSTA
jgi:hypothetical protein